MNTRARILFTLGSVGLALGGLLHMWGQFGGENPPLARAAIEAAMRAYKIEAMGMTHSLMDVMQCWGVFFGVLAIFGGVQNLIVVALLPRSAGVGTLAASSAACTAVLLGLGIRYHIAPPVIVFSVVFLCFAAATAVAMATEPSGGDSGS
jgi:hypothetical protein